MFGCSNSNRFLAPHSFDLEMSAEARFGEKKLVEARFFLNTFKRTNTMLSECSMQFQDVCVIFFPSLATAMIRRPPKVEQPSGKIFKFFDFFENYES